MAADFHRTLSPSCFLLLSPQLADAAIEEQLEVQTAFREQGARLQVARGEGVALGQKVK